MGAEAPIGGTGTERGVSVPAGFRLQVIGAFAVRGRIQAFAFVFFRDAQADGEIDDLVGDHRTTPDHTMVKSTPLV